MPIDWKIIKTVDYILLTKKKFYVYLTINYFIFMLKKTKIQYNIHFKSIKQQQHINNLYTYSTPKKTIFLDSTQNS